MTKRERIIKQSKWGQCYFCIKCNSPLSSRFSIRDNEDICPECGFTFPSLEHSTYMGAKQEIVKTEYPKWMFWKHKKEFKYIRPDKDLLDIEISK